MQAATYAHTHAATVSVYLCIEAKARAKRRAKAGAMINHWSISYATPVIYLFFSKLVHVVVTADPKIDQ